MIDVVKFGLAFWAGSAFGFMLCALFAGRRRDDE